jgi:hypothetical protein
MTTPPAHYVMEGWIISQHGLDDDTPITAEVGSAFYQSLGCTSPTMLCTGSAKDWVDVAFGGYFTEEHTIANMVYLVGTILLTRMFLLFCLQFIMHIKN